MMRVFVFESLMAGPLDADGAPPPKPSLIREGRAMLSAIVADFAAIAGVEVTTLLADDCELEPSAELAFAAVEAKARDRARTFDRLASNADWTMVIAPEIGGELLATCRRVLDVGGRLLASSLDSIELLSDKHRTAAFSSDRGVPVSRGVVLAPGPLDRLRLAGFPFPAVEKPLDGCGSIGVRWVSTVNDLAPSEHPRRLEKYVDGFAASVAAICGPGVCHLLPPCSQRIADDGRFAYLGGSAPLVPSLADRANSLARQALKTIPGLAGYVGVDLVLGNAADGTGDVVIEINPRLTTSYVGLRRLAETNLAKAMLDTAAGVPIRALSFRPGRVEFDCCGHVDYDSDVQDPATSPECLAAP